MDPILSGNGTPRAEWIAEVAADSRQITARVERTASTTASTSASSIVELNGSAQ